MEEVIGAARANQPFASIPLVAQEAATSATPDDPQDKNIETASPARRMSFAAIVQRAWNSDGYNCDTPAALSTGVIRLIAVRLARTLFEDVVVGPTSDFGLHLCAAQQGGEQ